MKILLINKFLYPKGGDAVSTLLTGRLLSEKGHRAVFWGMEHPENQEYPYKELFVSFIDFNKPMGLFQQVKTSLNLLYSFEAKNKIKKLLKMGIPNVVHLNNFAHQISPSILKVFKKYKIPIVMTLRDYKLVCPAYTMFLNGKICEKCKNGKFYWCFFHRCTKNSYLKSFLNVVEMYLHHKILHIYNEIDIFIATSKFLKKKIKEMGLKGKVVLLPNFIYSDKIKPFFEWKEKSLSYFGRLSPEKGICTLLEAIKGLDIKLKIFGDGPIRTYLEEKVSKEKIKNVRFFGYKSQYELRNEIKNSMFVVFPSEWYEPFGRTAIESFALGKPVIGSRIGGIPELIKDGETGLTFETGNADDLRKKILYLINDPHKAVKMGKNARKFVEEKFNSEKHYQRLMEIYQIAIGKS